MKMSSIPEIALMIDNETLRDKILHRAVNIQKLEQINLESEWTEFLKNLVDYGNKDYLRNFSLCLEIVVDDDTKQNLGSC
jgi:hypothetical protein